MGNIFSFFIKGKINSDSDFQDKPLLCPRCLIYMEKIKKGSVTIDHCRKCNGIWLDDSEIEKLDVFYE